MQSNAGVSNYCFSGFTLQQLTPQPYAELYLIGDRISFSNDHLPFVDFGAYLYTVVKSTDCRNKANT